MVMRTACWTGLMLAALALAGEARASGLVSNGGGTRPIDRGATLPNGGKPPAKNKQDDGKKFERPELPPLVQVRLLDTTKFDALAGKLGLNRGQEQQILAAKKAVIGEIAKLMTDQEDARAAYLKSMTVEEVRAGFAKVQEALLACQRYDPNVKLYSLLKHVLTPENWERYYKLME